MAEECMNGRRMYERLRLVLRLQKHFFVSFIEQQCIKYTYIYTA